ncbi:phosphopantetheine-binding [Rippkaea orientalis PCC 8801]|uniref:Phosphopantetheine-binding n=1 Tax=Rippkaea orientalis (strain PCC 8801 / RF-1) TaxID=41431 RepID=B7JWF9_RIPO1|nr:acyl carrier protein [Rippkaea orientalis]ACK67004.1 phosphopantetheine-binding [Rippkaea orientalis PCC 8801]
MSPLNTKLTAQEIQQWLVDYVAKKLKKDPREISIKTPLSHYGIDSFAELAMIERLETWLNMEIDPTISYDFPTIQQLSNKLAKDLAEIVYF